MKTGSQNVFNSHQTKLMNAEKSQTSGYLNPDMLSSRDEQLMVWWLYHDIGYLIKAFISKTIIEVFNYRDCWSCGKSVLAKESNTTQHLCEHYPLMCADLGPSSSKSNQPKLNPVKDNYTYRNNSKIGKIFARQPTNKATKSCRYLSHC